jgi:phosphoglycolate phosphatase-like HAD superfamily hydrolase
MCEAVPPQWVLAFDWDGTLVNTLPAKVASAGRLLCDEFGCTPDAIERSYRRHSGVPRRRLFDAIAADVGAPPLDDAGYARLSGCFTALNRAGLGPHILFPDVVETLRTLRLRQVGVAVSSAAALEEVRAGVEAVGLAPMLDEVLGSDGEFAKGSGHLDYLERRFGVTRDRIWMVGDEVADLRLGREAGVRTVGRLGTCTYDQLLAEQPAAIVGDLYEILDVLAQAATRQGH